MNVCSRDLFLVQFEHLRKNCDFDRPTVHQTFDEYMGVILNKIFDM